MATKTEISTKVIKEYLLESIKSVPGISSLSSENSIVINNKVITINVSCLPSVRPFEVCLMAQRTLYYGLYRHTNGEKFTINILINSIK